MKLSELLSMHPQLDVEIGPMDERVILDGVYLFRALDVNDPPGAGVLYLEKTEHTDMVVEQGLVFGAYNILQSRWPVHLCEGEH